MVEVLLLKLTKKYVFKYSHLTLVSTHGMMKRIHVPSEKQTLPLHFPCDLDRIFSLCCHPSLIDQNVLEQQDLFKVYTEFDM